MYMYIHMYATRVVFSFPIFNCQGVGHLVGRMQSPARRICKQGAILFHARNWLFDLLRSVLYV